MLSRYKLQNRYIPATAIHYGGQDLQTDVMPNGMTVTSSVEKKDPDHIYINVNINNNTSGEINVGQIIQVRDQPFLKGPNKYCLTLARFSVNSGDVPCIIQDIPNGRNANWYVGVGVSGTYYDEFVTAPILSGQTTGQITDVNRLLLYMNEAWEQAIVAANTAATGTIPDQSIVITFDPATQLYRLNYPSYFLGSSIDITMSYELYTKFFGLDAEGTVGVSDYATDPHGVTFRLYRTGTNVIPNADVQVINTSVVSQGTGDWMFSPQSAAWGGSICDNVSLVITTNSLPIIVESTLVSQTSSSISSGNTSLPILSDFLIGRNTPGFQSQAEPYVYLPPFYRLVDMVGSDDQELYQYDIGVQIKDFQGRLTPLKLFPNSGAEFKLLFIKKGLTN